MAHKIGKTVNIVTVQYLTPMFYTLTTYLDLLRPWLAPELVPEPQWQRIRAIGRDLPVLSFGCFECWLAPESSRVDFNISATSKLNELTALRDWPLPEHGHRARAHIRDICNRWSAPGFPLRPLLDELWVVYDLPETTGPEPDPWVYISYRQTPLHKDPELRAEIAGQTLALMQGGYSPTLLEGFHRFFAATDPDAQLCAIGTQTSREHNFLRAYFALNDWETVRTFLAKHGWPGDPLELQEQLGPLTGYCSFFGLTLDLGPELQPKIGIECWFAEAQNQDHLDQFTRYLCEQGWCTPAKRDALLAWNGRFEVETQPDFWSWPEHLQAGLGDTPQSASIRRMARYIKMVYEPGKAPVAKGYLYFDRLLKSN